MPTSSGADPRVSRTIWAIAIAMLAAVAVSYAAIGLSLDLLDGWQAGAVIPLCLGLATVYRVWRPEPLIAAGAETAAQIMTIMLAATLLTYPAAAADFPYRDASLHAADQWLGFDWRAYLAFFNSHPVLGLVLSLAYFSMKLQFPAIIAVLAATARLERLQTYTLALAVALLVAIPIFMVAPAIASYAYLGVPPADFANLSPSVPYGHIPHLEGMRNGTTHVIRLNHLEGMITFPSFHTTAALIFCWAAWPVRWLRWWVVALNVLLIASTPIDGAHYAIDLIAGAGLAVVAVAVAGAIRRLATRGQPAAVATAEAANTPSAA